MDLTSVLPPTPGELEKEPTIATAAQAANVTDVHQAEKDRALALLTRGPEVAFDPNSDIAKRTLRKIDWHIMPLCFAIYLLQILDKNSLSFANIMGIRADANINGNQYSWLGSIVYFGYLAGEIPLNFGMQRFNVTRYLAFLTCLWGCIVALHAACSNFGGLAAVRFLLGSIEVITAPAVMVLTGAFYTKSEQMSRVMIWYSGASMAQVVGGFLAWCLYHSDHFAWQGFFILLGGLTIGFGVLVYFFLAPSPSQAKWLTEEEKVIALERLRANRTGTEVWGFNRAQVKEAFLDVRLYLFFLLLITTGLPSGGITAFGPAIIRGFGFSTARTTLLSMVPGAVETLGMPVAVYIGHKTTRGIAGIYCLLLATIGVLMMLYIDEDKFVARYVGYVIMMQFPICVIFIISWLTSAISGTTKKFVFHCAYQIGYAVGNLVGPQTYRPYDAPQYYIAKYVMLATILGSAGIFAIIQFIHWRWNKQRDAKAAQNALSGLHRSKVENEEFMDLTDFQQEDFRYPL